MRKNLEQHKHGFSEVVTPKEKPMNSRKIREIGSEKEGENQVWKLQKFSLTLFSQKFRESDGFTNEITK